jgi:hypothetical protein
MLTGGIWEVISPLQGVNDILSHIFTARNADFCVFNDTK